MHRLAGLNILLVEDEAFIALDIGNLLAGASCTVLGPFNDVRTALTAVERTERIDCGLLDLNVGNEHTLSIADALMARAIPFVWVSGYGREILPARYRDQPFLAKPFLTEELLVVVDKAIGQKSQPAR